jgi:hypothetical protein
VNRASPIVAVDAHSAGRFSPFSPTLTGKSELREKFTSRFRRRCRHWQWRKSASATAANAATKLAFVSYSALCTLHFLCSLADDADDNFNNFL